MKLDVDGGLTRQASLASAGVESNSHDETKCKEMKEMSELTPKQEKLIAYLVTERTIEEACRKAKVAPVTYWRWMKDYRFVQQYRRVRVDLLEASVTRLQGLSARAIDALERNLKCGNPGAEIRAATSILEFAVKGLETMDMEARVALLEAVMESRKRTYA